MYKSTEENEEYVKHIRDILLNMVNYCNDWKFIQNECLYNIEYNKYSDIVQLSIICLGHIARIHKCINRELVLPLLNEKINEKELFGFICDTIGDIEHFTGKLTKFELIKYPNLKGNKNIMDKNEQEILPKTITDKGIISEGGIFAWNKNRIEEAIEEIVKLNHAIIGGDVWAIKTEIKPNANEPVDYKDIYVGIIPFKNKGYTACNWHSEKIINENWDNFVLRSKKETLKYIFNDLNNIENLVEDELKGNIYYSLVFINELSYNELNC